MMPPAELRNHNFDTLRASLAARCAEVYAAFVQFGPGTTKQLAERSGIDLLTLRPRTTNLKQLGLLECVDCAILSGKAHGIYAVRRPQDWLAWRAEQFPISGQLQMGLNNQGALTT